MKKIVILMVLMVCVLVPGFSAVTDTMLNIGIQNSEMEFEYTGSNSLDFNIALEADFAMIFDNGPGFDVAFYAPQGFSNIELGFYYAHMIDVRSNFDILLTVGPRFGTDPFSVGLDAMCDLLFYLTRNVFVSVGAGIQMDFVAYKSSEWDETFSFTIPLPTVGIGVKF